MEHNETQLLPKTHMTYVRLDEGTHARLRELAAIDERPLAYLIRVAVEQYLNRRKVA